MKSTLVLALALAGCSYSINRPVPAPYVVVARLRGHSRAYDMLQAVREAEVNALEGQAAYNGRSWVTAYEGHAGKDGGTWVTVHEEGSCNDRGWLFVPAANLVAAFLPLCVADVEIAVLRYKPPAPASQPFEAK